MLSKPSLLLARQSWLVPLLLAIVTLVMHHSALNGFFRYDDGWHLGFAACYAPWEYFFVPGITREISYANLTPWNPLTYDINLTLFGLNPVGYYAHQLVSLWLAACMSFLLLRLWVGLGWAVFGAVLFLVGAPTVHIAQELMTGHYLEGLIFACVAIYGFVRAIRGDGRHWLVLGVLGYVLACTCKEIYVPLPVLFLALPESDWKKRFRFTLPFLTITFLYLCWRAAVLGTIVGGYQQEMIIHFVFSLGTALFAYVKLPMLLFRHNFIGYLALIALTILLVCQHLSSRLVTRACRRQCPAATPCSADDIVEVFLPQIVTYLWSGGQSRWEAPSLRVGTAAVSWSIPRIVLVLFIGVAAIQAGRAETKLINAYAKPIEALYRLFCLYE